MDLLDYAYRQMLLSNTHCLILAKALHRDSQWLASGGVVRVQFRELTQLGSKGNVAILYWLWTLEKLLNCFKFQFLNYKSGEMMVPTTRTGMQVAPTFSAL